MSTAEGGRPVAGFAGVTVRYGRAVAAERVSLEVPRGAVYALLGRNGAGKSSLVRCLLGQLRPSAGRALLFGADAWRTRARAMARLGVVPEEADVPPAMTARQALAFCARLQRGWDAEGALRRLERFGVPPNVAAGRLSKGQKGQLALTLALAPRPELLVLDDPTLGLDAVARRELYEELLAELAERGTTVFITTHDLAGIETIADRVGVLVGGRLVLDEPLEALRARFRRVRFGGAPAAAEAASGERLAALGALGVVRGGWGVETVLSRFEEASFARLPVRPGLPEPEVAGMSLEEIFVALHESGTEVRP